MRKHAESATYEESSEDEGIVQERTFVNFLKYKIYGDDWRSHTASSSSNSETERPTFLAYIKNMIGGNDPSNRL